jgi:uncharacterized protein involved in cysteine biosynthesis
VEAEPLVVRLEAEPLAVRVDLLHELPREFASRWSGVRLTCCGAVCLLNFLLVPQHSRVVFVAIFSFLHKTWLSWLSNRDACAADV